MGMCRPDKDACWRSRPKAFSRPWLELGQGGSLCQKTAKPPVPRFTPLVSIAGLSHAHLYPLLWAAALGELPSWTPLQGARLQGWEPERKKDKVRRAVAGRRMATRENSPLAKGESSSSHGNFGNQREMNRVRNTIPTFVVKAQSPKMWAWRAATSETKKAEWNENYQGVYWSSR